MSRTEKGNNGYKKGDRHRKGYYKEYYWKKKKEGNPHSWIKPNPFRADCDEEDKSDFDDYYDSFGAGEDVAESEGW
jgi:hypothetical protein